jgi:hypothetical protein
LPSFVTNIPFPSKFCHVPGFFAFFSDTSSQQVPCEVASSYPVFVSDWLRARNSVPNIVTDFNDFSESMQQNDKIRDFDKQLLLGGKLQNLSRKKPPNYVRVATQLCVIPVEVHTPQHGHKPANFLYGYIKIYFHFPIT